MDHPNYEIIEHKDIPEVSVLVAGFPGIGLIGGIASEQLINTLSLEQVASVSCDEFPPTTVIFDGVPRRPVRFFAGKGFLLVKSDMVIPPHLANSLAKQIIDWSVDNNIKEVIIFDGIPKSKENGNDNKIWGVISTHSAAGHAEKLDIDVIKRGAISGVSSSLLLYAHENKIEAVAMLAEGSTNMPDPRSAATLLDKFADYMEIDIDTSKLIESAEELEEEYARLVEQTKKAQSDMDLKGAQPPLYG
ncbi:MAG: PAC2 family protein [Thermoplasmata archaeon]